MKKLIEHGGKAYVVDTTPITALGHKMTFAEIYEIRERQVSGVLASTLSEIFDEAMMTLDRFYLSDDEKVQVVLELGHKFSTARAWKNLFDWAYFRQRKSEEAL